VIPLILLALLVFFRYALGGERQPSRVR
jgi:hypothetical protein